MTDMRVELARMSYEEVEEAVVRKATVLLPVGSLEARGRHSPLGADGILASYFVEQVASRTGAVVAPLVSVGYAPGVMGFAGTLTTRPWVLEAYLTDICRSLASHGFDHLVFVSTHQHNEPMCEAAAKTLKYETGMSMALLYPWPMCKKFMADHYADVTAVYGHGGEPETSVLMAISPDDIHEDRMEAGAYRSWGGFDFLTSTKASFEGVEVRLWPDLREISDVAVTGDFSGASAEIGQAIVDEVVDLGVRFVEQFKQTDTMVPFKSSTEFQT